MNTLKLGSSVTVIDPCYIPGSMHMVNEIQVIPGDWEPYIVHLDEGSWGKRVAKLGIQKTGFYAYNTACKCIGNAGVDSGQMMIIDTDAISNWEDNDKDEWPFGTGKDPEMPAIDNELSYFGACSKTLSDDHGTLEDLAVVSSSGYGDGYYPIFVWEKDGQVVRVEVDFFYEDEDDDEDWWDDEEEEDE